MEDPIACFEMQLRMPDLSTVLDFSKYCNRYEQSLRLSLGVHLKLLEKQGLRPKGCWFQFQ